LIAAKAREKQKGGQGGVLLNPTLDKAKSINALEEVSTASPFAEFNKR